MGTDVYLNWSGMTDADRERQITGYCINAGRVGYLRAAIWMAQENAFLRELFPKEYWEADRPDSAPLYNFRGSMPHALQLGLPYLVSTLRPPREGDQADAAASLVRLDELIKPVNDESMARFRFGVMWLSSLYDFFDLGIEKQKQEQRPYPLISW